MPLNNTLTHSKHTQQAIYLRKWFVLLAVSIVLAFSINMSDAQETQSDDNSGCEGSCVVVLFKLIDKSVKVARNLFVKIGTEQVPSLGLASQQLVESTSVFFDTTRQQATELSKIKVNEDHLLKEKVETLKIKQNINDTFGIIADDVALAASIKDIGVHQKSKELLDEAMATSKEISSVIKGVGLRTRVLSELPPETIGLIQALGADYPIAPEMNEAYSIITKSLVDSVWFPAPAENTSNENIEYKIKYEQRQRKIDIAFKIVQEYVVSKMATVSTDAANEYFNTLLSEAGIPTSQNMVSEEMLIMALGYSQFGSNNAASLNDLSGDELNRKYAFMLATNNYLMAKYAEQQQKLNLLSALKSAMNNEDSNEEALLDALNQ